MSSFLYFKLLGYSGVFICGASPYWIFLTGRGELRTHSMVIDGEVLSFAPFNNVNCPQGFLYFNKKVITELLNYRLYTFLNYSLN